MSQFLTVARRIAVVSGISVFCIGVAGCGGKSSSGTNADGGTDGGTGGGTGAKDGGVTGTGGRVATGGAGVNGSGGSVSGTGGAGGGTAVSGTNIGKACASAADCGPGITCLLPTDKLIFGAGGPANGYCTIACTATTCPDGSTCVNTSLSSTDPVQAYCMQTCTFGPAAVNGPLKCQGRAGDVACTQLRAGADGGASADVCIPTCSQDSDCPASRKCDELSAVCVDAQQAGSPQGAHCDSQAATDQCAGTCLPIGTGTTLIASFCSRRCVVGVLNGCNWVAKTDPLTTGGTHGICMYSAGDADIGDVGYCGQECDTVSDCSDKTDPGAACNTTSLDSTLNSHGFCDWSGPADAGTGG